MHGEAVRIALFGSGEPPAPYQTVEIGNLTCRVTDEAIRRIAWNGVEVIRAINWPVRDESWITLPQSVRSAALETRGDEAHYRVEFDVADGALECVLSAVFSSTGTLSADLSMTATRDFDTNRAGFTLLHPIHGVAGEPVEILHSDGRREATRFPRFISAAQPAMDIAGLRHDLGGVTVDMAFEGEVFEMEDQRNWTDASFKTYCRPLVFPFTYRIAKGESIRQSIRVSLTGGERGSAASNDNQIELSPGGALPEMALAAEAGWLPDESGHDLLRKTGVQTLQMRLGTTDEPAFPEQAKQTANALQADIDLEIVVPQDMDPQTHFRHVQDRLLRAGISPAHVIAVPEPYLKSHQPTGPWPDGPTPADCVNAARKMFDSSRIGGGVLTNFTEFNRCPPEPEDCDLVSHGTTALVHAADDLSVCETIEALSHVFESAIHIGAGKPYRLGLASIGMRSNPYGADVADNRKQVRQTMARYDPRQCGTFAAAFAVGVVHATQAHAVDAIALAAPAGPFAVIAQEQPVERAYFDQHPEAVVYPLFHVVRTFAQMKNQPRQSVNGLPQGVHAVAAGEGDAWRIVIANLGDQPQSLKLPRKAEVRSLDASSFHDAVHDPDWLTNSEPVVTEDVDVEPYCVVFAATVGTAP